MKPSDDRDADCAAAMLSLRGSKRARISTSSSRRGTSELKNNCDAKKELG